jgi:glycosyltransferase involved in cell wall biosynthesis
VNKKIVIISPAYPYRGGQAMVEAYLFENLSMLGYDCHTISFTLLYPKLFFPGETQFDNSKTIFFNHQDKIYRLINSINPFSWFKAIKEIKKLNPAVTLIVWWMPFFGPAYSAIAYFIKKLTKTKIVFLVENYISHENRWFDKLLSKITLGLTDYFICESTYIKNNIAEHHTNKPIFQTTLSVYDCYNLNRFNKEEAKKLLGIKTDKVILFFGLIRPYKGLENLIRAFKIIQKDNNVGLLIAGECYENLDKYIELISRENLDDKTLMVNKFIPNEDIEPFFESADVVCLPYSSASQSGILMMAYGFRKPVIVTNVGGLSELVVEGKTGSIIDNNNPDTIAGAIMKVLHNSENVNYETNIENLTTTLGYKNLKAIMEKIFSASEK